MFSLCLTSPCPPICEYMFGHAPQVAIVGWWTGSSENEFNRMLPPPPPVSGWLVGWRWTKRKNLFTVECPRNARIGDCTTSDQWPADIVFSTLLLLLWSDGHRTDYDGQNQLRMRQTNNSWGINKYTMLDDDGTEWPPPVVELVARSIELSREKIRLCPIYSLKWWWWCKWPE